MPKKKTSNVKKNTITRNESAKWNKENDKKLRILVDNSILDPLDLNSETIHRVIGDCLPGQSYKSFQFFIRGRLDSTVLHFQNLAQEKVRILLCCI